MENSNLLSRLQRLAQKSRKALRLYSSMARSGTQAGEFADMQIREWRDVNSELVKQLAFVVEQRGSVKRLAASVFALRDQFHSEWRTAETELHSSHKSLMFAVESSDFVRSAALSRDLISLKARVEAAQAVHHELQDVIDQCHLAPATIELGQEEMVEEALLIEPRQANVISLTSRRRRMRAQ